MTFQMHLHKFNSVQNMVKLTMLTIWHAW